MKAGKLPTRIPEAVIGEIRDRTDIVQVIDRYVRLKRTGVNYLGLCPFHEEKTPSFTVSPIRRTFYCFGCHEKGDVIDFVRKMEGKGFVEAVEDLASGAGIRIPRENVSPAEASNLKRRRDAKEKALKVNEIAAAFYQDMLQKNRGEPARSYLRKRNVEKDSAERFRLGYAPDSWDALTLHLMKSKVPAYIAERLGLVNLRRRTDGSGRREEEIRKQPRGSETPPLSPRTHHDFFRNRLMFPIMGPSGEVIGFSGRLLDPEADVRKYVNSPETPVFRKAESLYGIHLARQQMRRTGRAILVEGNLDVVKMHSAGRVETVAPLGTALTESQVNMIMRFAQKTVVLFDGDDAGKAASRKAARTLLKMGQNGWIARLPEGYDPDSYLDEKGTDETDATLKSAIPAADFLIEDLSENAGREIPQKLLALEKIVDVLESMPDKVARTLYIDRAAAALDIDREIVIQAMQRRSASLPRSGFPDSKQQPLSPGKKREVSAASKNRRHAVELISLLVSHPHLVPAAAEADAPSFVEDAELKDAIERLFDMQESNGTIVLSELLEKLDETLADSVAETVFSESFGTDIDAHRALREILTGIKLARIQYEWECLGEEMKQAGRQGDEDLLRKLALRRHELSARRSELIGERV